MSHQFSDKRFINLCCQANTETGHKYVTNTSIPFRLAQNAIATATIYDVTGKQIRMIELGHLSAGNYVESNRAIYWDGKTDTGEQISSGTYFYQIEADGYTDTRKMVILK